MVYDMIVVGAGAAGLFAGASVPSRVKGLFLEKSAKPGRKLLMSGSGQCNVTHGGDIRDFVSHYGANGSKIRSILYRFTNQAVIDFFEARGVSLFEREDGKVFPVSMRAQDVLDALLAACESNGFAFRYSSPVTGIVCGSDDAGPLFSLTCGSETFIARKLVISTGGCSYPVTGSDGSLFSVLEKLGIALRPRKPALVSLMVQNYPYADLAGIALSGVSVSLQGVAKKSGDLLLTHNCFSGPVILDSSRYASKGDVLCIDYVPSLRADELLQDLKNAAPGNKKQVVTVLSEYLNAGETSVHAVLPKRFLEAVCTRCGIDPSLKLSQLPLSALKTVVSMLKADAYFVAGTGGYGSAMATAGGVSLDDVNIRTLESKKYPGLYFAGEVLDVDGDTGGYNLQFAFSSGNLAAGGYTLD